MVRKPLTFREELGGEIDTKTRTGAGTDTRLKTFEPRPIDRKVIWVGLRGEGAEAQVTNIVEQATGYVTGSLQLLGEEGRRFGFASFQTEQDATSCIRALQSASVPASVKGERAERPVRPTRTAPKADTPTKSVAVEVKAAPDAPSDPATDLASVPVVVEPAQPAEEEEAAIT